jgi:hypothetical protein
MNIKFVVKLVYLENDETNGKSFLNAEKFYVTGEHHPNVFSTIKNAQQFDTYGEAETQISQLESPGIYQIDKIFVIE